MKGKAPAGYQIAAVARLTGLSADTIRAWERRHGLVRPLRDETGVRRYRKAEIVRLQRARQATERGHAIRIVARMTDKELAALVERTPVPPTTLESAPAHDVVETVLTAMREHDAQRARRTIRNASLLVEPRQLIFDVFVPLMDAVGRLWSEGEVSVWQEHLLSDIVASATGTLTQATGSASRDGFLFATPPGELHAFGITFAAILAAAEGSAVNNLGPNIPATELVRAATHLGTRCVVVGAPRSSHAAKLAVGFLEELEHDLPASIDLFVGGPTDFATATRAHNVTTLADFVDLLTARR